MWGAEDPSAVSPELGAMWLDEPDVGIVAGIAPGLMYRAVSPWHRHLTIVTILSNREK
jgi:hypothetical protein